MAWLQSRAFIGAKYEQSNSDYFYDWTQHNLAEEIPALATATCAVETTVTSGAATIHISVSAGTVPSSGGVWIAGNGSGQAWEYIQYSGITDLTGGEYNLTGCVREPVASREHNGIHTAGAIVRFWWQLDTMVGDFSFVEEMDDSESIIDWSANATGWLFPQAALRDGHIFIYQTKTAVANPFTNTLIGFLDVRNSEHDYRRVGQWNVKIVSSSGMINRYRARGVRRGKYNIALGASAQATDSLSVAWKERVSGDYVEAEPTFGASNAVDGDIKTLWISDTFIGGEPDHYQLAKASVSVGSRTSIDDPSVRTTNDGSGHNLMMDGGVIIISEIHLSPAVGQAGGYRYVEITCLNDLDIGTGLDLYLTTDNAANFIMFTSMFRAMVSGDTLVFCENEDKFREENPSANPTQLVDLSQTIHYNFLNSLSLSGGTLAIFYEPEATSKHFYHEVKWGTGGTATVTSVNEPITYTSDLTFGTALAVASNGQTYHYNYASNATSANNWDVGYTQSPGYSMSDKVWMLVELPPLGLMLAEDITDSYTGAILLTDGTEETTSGLASSGSIQIGDEVLSYNSRTATTITITGRAQSSTSAAAHVKDDPIYVYDSGLAINAFPIRTIEIARDGTIVPASVTIRSTKVTYPPRDPSQTSYTSDYEFSHSITGNTAQTITYNLASTLRMRHLLIEFDAMSVSKSRPRVNEVRALPDETFFDGDQWLYSGETATEMCEKLLLNVGFPAAAITANLTSGGGEHATANRLAWDVLVAYAQFAGLSIIVGRDSKITVGENGHRVGGDIITTTHTWQPSNTANWKLLTPPPEPVAQVIMPWQSADGSSSGIAYFPAQPTGNGEILEMPEQVFVSGVDAASSAEQLYWRKQFPYAWIAESSISGASFRPGQYHAIDGWTLNNEMQPISRYCLVRSVDHIIVMDEKSKTIRWHSIVNLAEINREAA